MKRKIKRNIYADEMTLYEAFEEFYEQKDFSNKAASTLRNYKQSFEFLCNFAGYTAETLCEDVNQNVLYQWANSLKTDGVKVSSINHYLRDVRTFIYWCMDADRGYMKPFKIKLLEGQEETIKLFSDEELELLLERPKRNATFAEWRTWAIVNFVLATGCRASTICDVRVGDIDFKAKDITLRHTKNKKAQTIPLSSTLETVLKGYVKTFRSNASSDKWLFCNVGDEKMTTNALRLSFGRYCEARGVNKTNIHGLRHNFAKLWIRNNGSQFTLQKLLGHSTLEMTRHYVKLFSEDIKEDYDRYSPLDTIKRNSKRTKKVIKVEE